RVSPTYRRARLFVLILFSAISLEAAVHHESYSLGLRILYFFVLLAIYFGIYLVTVSLAEWFTHRSRGGERQGVLGEHAITLTPEALQERTPVNDSKFAWRGLFRIDSTPEHIFIFVQPNAAHIIPRRAFATPAEADAFLATARSYYDA